MSDAAHFRREAERYRKLATEESNPVVAQRMRDFALHYEGLAKLMEESEPPPVAPPTSVPMQQQSVQQQQAKTEPTVQVHKSLQSSGYHWRVVSDGATIKSGTEATELDAHNAAHAVVERFVKSAPP